MLGIPFGKLKWKYYREWIKAIVAIVSYWLLFVHFQRSYQGIRVVQISRTVYGKLIDFSAENLVVCIFPLILIYYCIHGRSLIKLLDSGIIKKIYDQSLTHRTIAISILILINIAGLSISTVFLIFVHHENFSLYILVRIYLFCLMMLTDPIFYLTVHYFKYGTYQALKQLIQHLETNKITEMKCTHSLRLLADMNRRFNYFFSFIAMMVTIKFSFFNIIVLFHIYLNDSVLVEIVLIYSSWSFYLFHLDSKIQQALIQLIKVLRNRNRLKKKDENTDNKLRSLLKSKVMGMFEKKKQPNIKNICSMLIYYLDPSIKKKAVYFEMFEIYSKNFQMSIYNLCYYNASFYLKSIVFVFGYFLLIIHTDNRTENKV